MASVAPFPSTAPMPAVARILSRFNRVQLHGFIAVAIDLADAMDGDSDVEPNGDELDGTNAEDEEYPRGDWIGAAGCPISDPPEDDTEDCCVAGDDTILGGARFRHHGLFGGGIEHDDDDERSLQPAHLSPV